MKNVRFLNIITLITLCHTVFAFPNNYTFPVNITKTPVTDGGKLIGKVVESPANTVVSFATVALLASRDSTLANGVVADENGVFTITNVSPGNYILRVTNMGYQTRVVANVKVAAEGNLVDLGNIVLVAEAQKLSEVLVKGERSMIVDDIDKKMVTIGKDLLANSNNVSDLLEKIPAVSLDENGNPQVRGKGNVVVLIDGKPSNLYGSDLPTILQSFPANLIERIDVMTTPSAKYEGEGASGVIDIITKKSKIRGTNGGMRLSLGNKNNHNASGNLNYRAGKFGLNASLSGNTRAMTWKRTLSRDNFISENTSHLEQSGKGGNNGNNTFGRVGMNYDINEKNSLELGMNYSRDNSRNNSNLLNETSLVPGVVSESFRRINRGKGNGNNVNFNFDYRKKFADKDHQFNFTSSYSLGGSDGESYYMQESAIDSLMRSQQNLRHSNRKSLFLNTDYTWPITPKSTLEVGLRSRMSSNDNTNSFYNMNRETGSYEFDQNISNVFAYSDATYTGLMTFSQKTDLWGMRAGLRVTDYNQNIDQISIGREFGVHFLTLVPSLALTRKLGESSQMKLNYSRRVQRPEADWLNPYTDVSDPRNVKSGNPNLRPEFTHKAEMGYSNYESSGGFGPSLFMDYSNNAITQIRTIDESGISLTRYDNVGRELAYGLETDFSQKIGEVLKINGSGRFFRSEVVSTLAQINNRTWSYSGNLNAFITLPADFRVSAYVNYEGPRAIAQGTREGVFIANMGIRKDFLEKKATISFNVQDIFLSRAYKSQLNTATYSQNSYWQQTNRLVNLTFQYRFGKISAGGNDA
ncbi:TonB-dependent receptor domain-containing protein [Dyadobacter arcticus]|uniref:Outer membrane receptor protein involved in Fe transport n=1 Tax=Dyadobacter arcticus TaxID=1078754 RepID=A0ABX0US96_9BACT|nr:TonB-dependent receptor [Dyadobacter arcticus]NIJ55834.1 outer membrane receptor protein involved in Fe transport [Dyadobacter arcticus]